MAREYKEGRRLNVVTQKMISVRLDNDLVEWLDTQPNKNRYINNLIRDDKTKRI